MGTPICGICDEKDTLAPCDWTARHRRSDPGSCAEEPGERGRVFVGSVTRDQVRSERAARTWSGKYPRKRRWTAQVGRPCALLDRACPRRNYALAPAPFNFYVDNATGNDTTGNGTPGAPFQTVTKARSVITDPLGWASIYVRAGNYGSDRPRVTQRARFANWGNVGQTHIGKPYRQGVGFRKLGVRKEYPAVRNRPLLSPNGRRGRHNTEC
jgi:hypothetical protein